ncbi:alpha/beta hydrolase fold protein [Dinoroseobacter shibae DFL 12 = DSM 16493]|jgi:pimeloyl-ACP methyl ester carboxylesterase|uniref:Alpha/beta hydrolase fold protein n=1 Tax=Dinoroseobacter shibae (strain DSM 16493 / NCIMB 14021 / DFL 12) TaxID=398580 RepID=A8LRB5_DINSH|nr:alpha/beta fold hydrolase [Dinoroseobacter shibae]ABV92565.1 alpha/beta hydrolase fold protein [Dinoroseobacter shibae DFL 12 = DSM 16493]URF47508.1 alpha/beta fold hydrolase [Dinoroseobacter shibae]URF51819.1 alpha/beta fold hydrolase [Dinoroseobacter shibae]
MLNTVIHGAATEAPPLLIVHGLFGSAKNWGAIAKRMAQHRQVLAVDLRNHGDSPHTQSHSYPDLAADLAEVIAAHGGRADVLGHSMGGKAAMVLALSQPEMVARLLVADIAPVTYDRTQVGLIDAMEGVDLSAVTKRSDADAALAADVPDAPTRAFLTQSLDLRAEGGPRWRLNLATLRRDMPRIMGFPEIDGRYTGPTLFLRGGASDYVLPAHGAEIERLFPGADRDAIPDVGHWLHAEAPGPFIARLTDFLDA